MWIRWCIYCSILLYCLSGKNYAGQERSTPSVQSISFFIVAPEKKIELNLSDRVQLKRIIGTPGTADLALLRQYNAMPLVSGIPCLYLGTLTYSDLNGQIILPRIQEKNEVTLIISDRISPVIRHGNTVDKWELREKNRAARYFLQRIEEGEKNAYWTIAHEGPEETTVPNAAIVLLAPPDSLKVATSPVPTLSGPHLILPDIEITGKIPLQAAALNTITLNRFFEPVYRWTVHASERYASISQ